MQDEYYKNDEYEKEWENTAAAALQELQEPEYLAKRSGPQERKKNSLCKIFTMQGIIGCLILLSFCICKIFMPDCFHQFKAVYQAAYKSGEAFKEGADKQIQNTVDFLNSLTPLPKNQTTQESGNTGSTPPDNSQQNATAPAAPGAQGNAAQAAGGEENGVAANTVPANCTLSPIVYTGDKVLPINGVITSYFGEREYPLNGENDFHNGVDIAAAENTPILAMSDGIVKIAHFQESYGNYVRIVHADGFESLYAHCNALAVKAGDTVHKGQVIGYVGSTGASTGFHLHFSIAKDGIWINPITALFGN